RGALPAEQADFQIPGQSFSLKTGIAYLKQLLGRPDINVDVDITEGVDGFAAQVRTNPSTRQLMRPLHFGLNADRDEMMRTIAETIMGGVKPLVLASYRTALEQARCAKPGATARDYSTALELYRSILNDASSADHQWALLGRCNIYYLLDQAQEVQQACGLAISLYPDFDRPYVIRAMSAMGSDPAAAGADFQRAVEKNPHNASAYYFLGQLLQKSGKFDSAAAKFAMAESIEPGHVAALRRWGDALAAAERWDEARAVYRRALLIAPDDELSRAGWNNAVRIPADPAIHVIRR
ncbi:MAG TPA: tetratricopeptide repeat protein, partial [Telluria sp.]|nr:tetratricopeptide repeat protein [Telluria sp.]